MLPETGVCVCLCTRTFVCAHKPIWASTPEHSANLLHSYANKISYWKKMKLALSRSFMHFALYVLYFISFLKHLKLSSLPLCTEFFTFLGIFPSGTDGYYTVHGILQARILEWVAIPFYRGSSQLEIEPKSPTLQSGSLSAEPPGKSKNTGVGSLFLLQQIFPTQEMN